MTLQHNWLDDGGWYLLLPQRLLVFWNGAVGDDYDRFCAASDHWLNQLPVADGFGFALGGDPGMVLPITQRAETITLIRWQCADSEDELIAMALCGDNIKQTEPDIVFENYDSNWLLFNAAANPTADHPAIRIVAMPIGELLIQTAFVEHGTHAAIVHKIRLN